MSSFANFYSTLVYNALDPDDKKWRVKIDLSSMSETQPLSHDQTIPEKHQQQDVSKLFRDALSLQNEKKWDESLQVYQQILDVGQNVIDSSIEPQQASAVSHNISVIYYEKKEFALSYIFNQKAISLDPSNQAAYNFTQLLTKSFDPPNISHTMTREDQINNLGLKYIPLEAFYIMVFMLFFLFLQQFKKWSIESKKYELGQVLNRPAKWKTTALFFIILLVGGLTYFKFLQTEKTMAILKASKAFVAVEAGENQAQITEISQGLILEVLQTKKVQEKDYALVRYSGAFTGWLPQNDLELLNHISWHNK